MNEKDCEVLSYEIAKIRRSLYLKFERERIEAENQGDYIRALEISAKQKGLQDFEIELQLSLTEILRGLSHE